MLNNTQNTWRSVTTKIVASIGIICILLIGLPVIAEAYLVDSKLECGKTKFLKELLEKNHEQIIASGLANGGVAGMTLWVNENGEWTILVTPIANLEESCIIVFGNKFRTFRPRDII